MVETGVYIRAQVKDIWESVDIGDDRVSAEDVTHWLRSRGGMNPWAENLLLAFINKEQIAHEVPFTVDVSEIRYNSAGETLILHAHDDGIILQINSRATSADLNVPITDVRVYNALIQLISAIQVHDRECMSPTTEGIQPDS